MDNALSANMSQARLMRHAALAALAIVVGAVAAGCSRSAVVTPGPAPETTLKAGVTITNNTVTVRPLLPATTHPATTPPHTRLPEPYQAVTPIPAVAGGPNQDAG